MHVLQSFLKNPASQPLLMLAGVFAALVLCVFAIFSYMQAPFYWLFDDMPALLILMTGFYLTVIALWDTTVLLSGVLDAQRTRNTATPVGWSDAWQRLGLASLGCWPLLMLLITSYTMLLSSNVTLLSLHSIQHGITQWRDAWFWNFESGLIEWLGARWALISVVDVIYVACWPIQLVAMLWLFMRQRSPRKGALFCASYGLLYFSGRLIGCLMPVLGPLFYKPEFYTHMNATLTHAQVERVREMLHFSPEMMQKSGVLLGGVSAMPSLHVAMVSLCAYWIWREYRWLAPVLVQWVLITWYTTVALGWHYALDGLGAILLTAFVVWSINTLNGLMGHRVQ